MPKRYRKSTVERKHILAITEIEKELFGINKINICIFSGVDKIKRALFGIDIKDIKFTHNEFCIIIAYASR